LRDWGGRNRVIEGGAFVEKSGGATRTGDDRSKDVKNGTMGVKTGGETTWQWKASFSSIQCL